MRLRTRHVALTLAVLVVAALTVGTGGFSSMTADRGVAVSVADDEDAYLGIDVNENANATSGNETTLFTLTNRFATTPDLNVSITRDGAGIVDEVTGPGTLSDGTGPVTATVTCDENKTEQVTIKIVTEGTDISVKKDKSIEVGCTATSEDDGEVMVTTLATK